MILFFARRNLLPVNSWHELLSFLRNKRDVCRNSLHTLSILSSNAKFNWGLIINTDHALLSLTHANLFQGLLFVIFSKWIISSGPKGARSKEKIKSCHMSLSLKTSKVVTSDYSCLMIANLNTTWWSSSAWDHLAFYGCTILRQPQGL